MEYSWGLDWLLYFAALIICLWASAHVNSVMRKFKKVQCHAGLTGSEVARRILDEHGLYHVSVNLLGADSGDHYDPRTQSLNLSNPVYYGTDITAVSIAAHECGHAVQHSENYMPLSLRSAMVPVVNIGSRAAVPILILGLILDGNMMLIQIALIAFALSVVFSFVTLPVEFDASRRALVILNNDFTTYEEENRMCKKVLTAAALTYVASTAAACIQLLRYIMRYGNRK